MGIRLQDYCNRYNIWLLLRPEQVIQPAHHRETFFWESIYFSLFAFANLNCDRSLYRTMLSAEKSFSILIPTWNNLPFLKLCIKSIRSHSRYHHQILVHVNEGSDGTLEWIKGQSDILYTHSSQNIGICYALNILANSATTDYIMYLNDDMYLCPEWDAVLVEEIEKLNHSNFFFSLTSIEMCPQSNCMIQGDFGSSYADFDEEKLLQDFNKTEFHDWHGATWAPNIVPKELWEKVGGYSIEFSPGMYSDPDFSMKLWKAGVRLFKGIGGSRVYHFGSVSVKRIKKNKGYYRFISKWGITNSIFSKKYLQRGQLYNGYLAEPEITLFTRISIFPKKVMALFQLG